MVDWRRYRDFFGPNPHRELTDEIAFHLETEIEELVASGIPHAEARRRALERFGDVDRFFSDCRASDARRLERRRRARVIDVLRQDVRDAVRGLVRRPAFAASVVLVLAIGVGANAAAFSLVDHLFLRPPAGIADPSALRRIFVTRQRENGTTYFQVRFPLPEAQLVDSAIAKAFPSTIYYRGPLQVEVERGAARTLTAAWITPTYFPLLGVRLLAGSDFGADSARFDAPATSAIISWSLWQRAFAGDPRAIGRAIRVDGNMITVRGIAPRSFSGIDVDVTDIWLPLGGFRGFGGRRGPAWYDDWGLIAFRVLARVPPGASTSIHQTYVRAGIRQGEDAARKAGAKPRDTLVEILPSALIITRGPERLSRRETIAAVLAGLAALLLIIAIANVANLLVGRAMDRQRETAVRVALGMTRLRVYTQVAVESLILAAASTLAAIVAAQWMGAALRRMVMPGVELATGPVDGRTILLAASIGTFSALVAALVPLATAPSIRLTNALKGGARDGGPRRSRARAALVAVQAGLSVLLLVGTGLLGRSLYNIRTTDLGLDAQHLVAVKTPEDSTPVVSLEDIAGFARSLPGVRAVSLSMHPPLWDQFEATHVFTVDRDTVRALDSHVGYVAGDAGYLRTIGTRVLRGRDFSAEDRAGAPPVMIVSEELARRVWPRRNPLGECLRIDRADAACHTVVGVAEDAHRFEIVEEAEPVFYVPLEQRPGWTPNTAGARAVVVRVTGETDPVVSRLRLALGDTATTLRERRVIALSELLSRQYEPWELGARLFAGLTVLAVALALLGLYGVLNYVVTVRRREIGVRMALGANRSQVIALVLREVVRHVALGAAVGIGLSLLLAGRVGALLYRVSPHDPAVLASTILVLAVGAVVAAVVPARRAMGVDPMTAIRDE